MTIVNSFKFFQRYPYFFLHVGGEEFLQVQIIVIGVLCLIFFELIFVFDAFRSK